MINMWNNREKRLKRRREFPLFWKWSVARINTIVEVCFITREQWNPIKVHRKCITEEVNSRSNDSRVLRTGKLLQCILLDIGLDQMHHERLIYVYANLLGSCIEVYVIRMIDSYLWIDEGFHSLQRFPIYGQYKRKSYCNPVFYHRSWIFESFVDPNREVLWRLNS